MGRRCLPIAARADSIQAWLYTICCLHLFTVHWAQIGSRVLDLDVFAPPSEHDILLTHAMSCECRQSLALGGWSWLIACFTFIYFSSKCGIPPGGPLVCTGLPPFATSSWLCGQVCEC